MSKDPTTPPTGTQAIERALGLLDLLALTEEMTVGELAAASGLSPATVSRMARALTAAGMTRRNPRTDAYHLGARAAVLGQAAQRALGLDKALPSLEALRERTQESVNLAVRELDESVVLLRAQSTLPLRFVQEVGARFPLYSTASGKVMLAFSSPEDGYVDRLPARLTPVTPGTLATRAELAAQLEQVRVRGFAIDMEENVEGVRCVGAPVFDEHQIARAAVVVQAPAVRMPPERLLELGPVVAGVAAEVRHVIPDPHALRSQG
ncbi:IclR family transcriptional regulator [Metallococcus carri]|uniref:IclR family transcriptional regulator n=1 Tax=Metallococcus carri TaxID=1656884 RepID=UPI001A9F52C9|nr:IclR family transcriptional regulator [Metallococcus carri]